MNFNSIITKLIFIYLIMVGLFGLITFGYHIAEQAKQHEKISEGYHEIAQHARNNKMGHRELIVYVESLNFKFIQDPKSILEQKEKPIMIAGPGFESIHKNKNYFINLHTPFARLLFQDLNKYEKNYYGYWIIGIIFILMSGVFLWIIQTLKPLKDLKNEIQDFANGNLNIKCKSDKKDEIAQVANEFDKAVKKISLLLESRQLFLRTVMHELKTPIAKGKIVTSLIDDKLQQDRISLIFDKLNLLIDDFAKTEQVISKNYTFSKQPFSMGAIINNSVEMMMLDKSDEKIKVEGITNKKLSVDFELFSLAIKNLIDNGIKYSVDKKVILQEKENAILVISIGDKLTKPLEEYFKPFHNETKSKNHGMGLGLYIVYSIVEMHNMKFDYLYENGKNIFEIKFYEEETSS